MNKNGFKIKKHLGQNFITDYKICKKIVNLAKIEQEDVIEIGPGLGALTKELLKVTYSLIAIYDKNSI